MKNPVASSPNRSKTGQAAFQKNCRFCHGADAKGNGRWRLKGLIRRTSPTTNWIGDRPTARSPRHPRRPGPKFDMKGLQVQDDRARHLEHS